MPDWKDYGIAGKVNYGQSAKALVYRRLLERKTAAALEILQQFLDTTEGRVYVSISFGVDSLVAYDLCRRLLPRVQAVWVNQGPLAEWPDCLALKDLMVAQGLPLVEIEPETTLYDWYKEHGIELAESMNTAEDKVLNDALLHRPLLRFQAETEMRGHTWGLRGKEESAARRKNLMKRSLLYLRQSDQMWVCSPVGWWTKAEIFAYLDLHGLPYPAFYDVDRATIRNGPPIGVTAANLGRLSLFRQRFPELWRVFCLEFPEIQRYG